ncbi:uncharacterized protein LOC144111274 isoform X2 [Amblyomma americanum]
MENLTTSTVHSQDRLRHPRPMRRRRRESTHCSSDNTCYCRTCEADAAETDRHFNWVTWCPMYLLLAAPHFLGCLPINDDGRVKESLELPVVNEAPDGSEVLLSLEDSLPEGSRRDGLSQIVASPPFAVPVLQYLYCKSQATAAATQAGPVLAQAAVPQQGQAAVPVLAQAPKEGNPKRAATSDKDLL